MSKYQALVHFKKHFGKTVNDRQIEVIEYLKEHHCKVSAIEEIALAMKRTVISVSGIEEPLERRKGKIMFRHKINFEDGEMDGISYSNISEMLQGMDDLEFISIKESSK
jgi:hypothetical protein